jgi:hypothetical protein
MELIKRLRRKFPRTEDVQAICDEYELMDAKLGELIRRPASEFNNLVPRWLHRRAT